MSAVFIESYSAGNREVFELSLSNHAAYCERHGYRLINIDEPYNPYIDTARIRHYLERFQLVVVIGADVVIQCPKVRIEQFASGGISMCPEYGGGTLNGDLIVFSGCRETYAVLDKLDAMQRSTPDGQTALNHLHWQGFDGIHAVEKMQIAAPKTNPDVDYSGVDLREYFALHYHRMGFYAWVADKVRGMREDAGKFS